MNHISMDRTLINRVINLLSQTTDEQQFYKEANYEILEELVQESNYLTPEQTDCAQMLLESLNENFNEIATEKLVTELENYLGEELLKARVDLENTLKELLALLIATGESINGTYFITGFQFKGLFQAEEEKMIDSAFKVRKFVNLLQQGRYQSGIGSFFSSVQDFHNFLITFRPLAAPNLSQIRGLDSTVIQFSLVDVLRIMRWVKKFEKDTKFFVDLPVPVPARAKQALLYQIFYFYMHNLPNISFYKQLEEIYLQANPTKMIS